MVRRIMLLDDDPVARVESLVVDVEKELYGDDEV